MTTPYVPPARRGSGTVSPSPAREALQCNLASINSTDAGLTLAKKKSWFGSARNSIFRHVGSWRGERPDLKEELSTTEADNQLEFMPTADCEVTPLRPSPPRSRTFTPKHAINSLRQHMHHSSQRHKRAALPTPMNEQTFQQQDPSTLSDEQVTSDAEDIDNLSPLKSNNISPKSHHTRRTSLSMSLVGSVRRLSRQATFKSMSPTKRSKDELISPTKDASQVPLPSSPIPIRTPPTLSLDLGPAALGRISPDMAEVMNLTNPLYFLHVQPLHVFDARIDNANYQQPEDQITGMPTPPEQKRDLEQAYSDVLTRIKSKPSSYMMTRQEFAVFSLFMDRTDGDEAAEAAFARYWANGDSPTGGFASTPNVPTYYTRIAGEGPEDQSAGRRQSLRPSDVLGLPTDEFGFSPPSGPATPMPGTAQGFDFDGTNDSTEVFERSVEYKDRKYKKENRRLKNMPSLDAVADPHASPLGFGAGGKAIQQRRLSTLTTVDSVPEDMSELTRQAVSLPTPSAGHRDPNTGAWQSDDPFAPGNVIGDIAEHGVPSPTRSVKLPVRPKITIRNSESPKETREPASVSPHNAASSDSDAGEYGDFKAQHCFPDLSEKNEPVYHSRDRSDSALSIGGAAAILVDLLAHNELPSQQMEGLDNIDNANAENAFEESWTFTTPWRQAAEDPTSSLVNSPATTEQNRTPNMGEKEAFDLKRSQRNMRYNALSGGFHADPDHEDETKTPSACPSPLRPRLCLDTAHLEPEYRRRLSPKKDVRHADVGMSSDSVDPELKDMVAQHYQFKNHIDALAPEDTTSGLLTAGAVSPTENPFSPASEAYSSHLSPNSKKIWSNVVRNPFDTPPAVSPSSQHHREDEMLFEDGNDSKGEETEVCDYTFETPESKQRRENAGATSSDEASSQPDPENLTESLAECLEIYRTFNHSQGQLPSKSSEATIKADERTLAAAGVADPFSSPDSGYDADDNTTSLSPGASGSPSGRKRYPARYRSIKGMREIVDEWGVGASPPRSSVEK